MQMPSTKFKEAAIAELARVKSLKTTRVQPGYFMDFWGNRERGVKSNFPPMPLFVDISNAAAAIPGDGNEPVILTHTTDVGRFVAALLDVEGWDEVSFVAGDKVSMNTLLAYAENATGTSDPRPSTEPSPSGLARY